MRATEDVLHIWKKFDSFPMETITKAWHFQLATGNKQRTVEQMILHRELYGTSGNCYDLAIWLLDEFKRASMKSYAILTPNSHVAVVAVNENGDKYLCDLGDQWIEPILINPESEDFTEQYLEHFFPGARVKLQVNSNKLLVMYRRPNGKTMRQTYLLDPISEERLLAEGEKTQRRLNSPLVEKRIFNDDQVIHWEFDDYNSFYSSMEGKQEEEKLHTIEEWAERISNRSGIHQSIVIDSLEKYARRS